MADLQNYITQVEDRASALEDVGYSPRKALALAIQVVPYDEQEAVTEALANKHDIDSDSFSSYRSKGKTETYNAVRQFISEYGGHRAILADTESMYRQEHYFIVADISRNDIDYDDAIDGEERVMLLKVTGGGPSGEPAFNLSMGTVETAPSLSKLAEAIYDPNKWSREKLNQWYSLLIDAGMDEEELDHPDEALPPSHPDSPDHVQYQLKSIERNSGRDHPDRRI